VTTKDESDYAFDEQVDEDVLLGRLRVSTASYTKLLGNTVRRFDHFDDADEELRLKRLESRLRKLWNNTVDIDPCNLAFTECCGQILIDLFEYFPCGYIDGDGHCGKCRPKRKCLAIAPRECLRMQVGEQVRMPWQSIAALANVILPKVNQEITRESNDVHALKILVKGIRQKEIKIAWLYLLWQFSLSGGQSSKNEIACIC